MKIFKKLQEKLIQRDLKNEVPVSIMVKKYPISILMEKKIIKRYRDTAFYCAEYGVFDGNISNKFIDGSMPLFTISGENIGCEAISNKSYAMYGDDIASKYLIVQGFTTFDGSSEMISFAVYDKNGECVVPHGCYKRMYRTENYFVLSMPERTEEAEPVRRINNDQDEKYEKIIGNLVYPRALLISDNKIITTKYSTIYPLRESKKSNTCDCEPKTVWLGQNGFKETKSMRIDKRMAITETGELPYLVNKDRIIFDEESNAVYYFTEGKDPKRVNLRNGDVVDLLSLKKIEKKKNLTAEVLHKDALFTDVHTML